MTGWNTIQEIRRLEAEFDKIGLKFEKPKYTDFTDDHGSVALVPKDDNSLPIYSRDTPLYVGSVEGARYWLQGLQWARQYDTMIKLSDDKKRARKEQDERNRQLIKILKDL
jgi:hypothetical protein